MSSFSIKDELMKLNKACPLRLFFKSCLWSSFIRTGLSTDQFIVILHMCDCFLAAALHSALALGPSYTAYPLFDSAHEYLIHTVLSNPPLDKDPIQVAKWGCFHIGWRSHQEALLCRINNFTRSVLVFDYFSHRNVFVRQCWCSIHLVKRYIFYLF